MILKKQWHKKSGHPSAFLLTKLKTKLNLYVCMNFIVRIILRQAFDLK